MTVRMEVGKSYISYSQQIPSVWTCLCINPFAPKHKFVCSDDLGNIISISDSGKPTMRHLPSLSEEINPLLAQNKET